MHRAGHWSPGAFQKRFQGMPRDSIKGCIGALGTIMGSENEVMGGDRDCEGIEDQWIVVQGIPSRSSRASEHHAAVHARRRC